MLNCTHFFRHVLYICILVILNAILNLFILFFRMTTNITTMDNLNSNYKSQTELSEIKSFYNDMTVFLTGATGFMGNLILEKLIR